jgi:CRISPR-associated endonuclease/helicase Cas3
MNPDDFARFYRAVHGYDPFPWQSRLCRAVCESDWPAVLALPTAAGKTSAIDVAVFALALQAGQPLAERRAPLRVFFVIDRRLVVDQAADHARRLRAALLNPAALNASDEDRAVVAQVAAALLRYGGAEPLRAAALRGGVYRDDRWADSPTQPTVCVTTVDQVGSRLLFRGYGLSEFARPVHAGLTGNDALYLLDEAHLSQPFLETLRRVGWYRDRLGSGGSFGPFRVVEISATPATPPEAGSRFGLSEDDRVNTELRRRMAVSKPTTLAEPVRFEQEVVRHAVAAQAAGFKVVGVVVNRVASAREVFRLLPGKPFEDKVLLTGRVRPWDRERVLGRFLDRVRAGRDRAHDTPLHVVATMTVEVGVDLDFDYLVTEAAPLAALRQRFGRLDRLGRFGLARADVLLRKQKGDDPVYGPALDRTWEWLNRPDVTSEAPSTLASMRSTAFSHGSVVVRRSRRSTPP